MEDGLTDTGIAQQDIARREGPRAVTSLHAELSRHDEGNVIVGCPRHGAVNVHLVLRMVGSVDANSRTTEQLGISRHGNPSPFMTSPQQSVRSLRTLQGGSGPRRRRFWRA